MPITILGKAKTPLYRMRRQDELDDVELAIVQEALEKAEKVLSKIKNRSFRIKIEEVLRGK